MSTGGGSSAPSTQTTISQVKLPDWVNESVQGTMAQAKSLADLPYQQYGGPTLAGLSPDQLAAFNAVRSMQGVAPGQIGGALDIAGNLPAATTSLLNPYMERVGGDVTSNMLRASALDAEDLSANAAARGAFGGTRDEVAHRVLASETQRNVGQALNQIAATGWTQASDTALKQAGLIGNLAQAGQRASLIDANALTQVGQAEQTQQQAGYAQALQQWQQQQNWPYQQMAIMQSALAGTPYGSTVQSQQPYNTNPAASALGMVAAGVPLLNSLPSAVNSLSNMFGPSNSWSSVAGNTTFPTGAESGWGGLGNYNPGIGYG